ncbi:hypothetical protein [Saccharopolyspora cebuensis]|uniref:Uncharacterized protein n=1 Tax=Saccharopolyspora cebuensis TaxID=418759 RepID=A0ABV4CGF0_9PSEU
MVSLELDPDEQNALLNELTGLVLESAPTDWSRIALEYKAIGRHVQVGAGAKDSAGNLIQWSPPDESWQLLWRLRVGMHRKRLGTWFSALYRLSPPNTYEIVYNRENEPQWNSQPSLADFLEEQSNFPRTMANTPAWFPAELRTEQREQ